MGGGVVSVGVDTEKLLSRKTSFELKIFCFLPPAFFYHFTWL